MREDAEMSRGELGEIVGYMPAAIGKVERDELRPPGDKLMKLFDTLGVRGDAIAFMLRLYSAPRAKK